MLQQISISKRLFAGFGLVLAFVLIVAGAGQWALTTSVDTAVQVLTVGVMADAVSEVVDIADEAIETPPSFGTHVRADFLTGMGKLENRLVLVLDVDRVLSPVEIQQTIDAAEAAEI